MARLRCDNGSSVHFNFSAWNLPVFLIVLGFGVGLRGPGAQHVRKDVTLKLAGWIGQDRFLCEDVLEQAATIDRVNNKHEDTPPAARS